MAEKRKLAKDWRDSYEYAKARVEKIENQIKERLKELCRIHPNAEIGQRAVVGCKDNSMILAEEISVDIEIYTANDCIVFIDCIEKWLAKQHPHQQSEIKFEDNCKCDGRDMPVYEEDDKRWCPQCGHEVK